MSPEELRRVFGKGLRGTAVDWNTQVLSHGYRSVEDPHLATEVARRTERNNTAARQLGLPEVGHSIQSTHGLEFVVQGHAYIPTAHTLQRWNQGDRCQPEDLYPIIEAMNMSKRFTDFVSAVDRCTTRILMVVDTIPHIRTWEPPYHNSIDTAVIPDSIVLYLDAARAHETLFAHEIGHAWVQYVDRCEDERVLKDRSDPARLHQLSFIQSYVLDLKVNDVLRRKGFDMSCVDGDLAQSMNALGRALSLGYRPENQREALFMALQVAAQIVERERSHAPGLVRFDQTLGRIRGLDPEIHALGLEMAEAAFQFGWDTKAAVQAAIDACLKLGFGFTGDALDLDDDLIVPQDEEPDFDKYPQWLAGAYPRVKCEIGRRMALEDISEGSRTHLENRGDHAMLSFTLPDGSTRGPWPIPVRFAQWLMDHRVGQVLRINQIAKERQRNMVEEVNRMNREGKARQEALAAQAMGVPIPPAPRSLQSPMPSPTLGVPAMPNPSPPFPGSISGRRPYMAGLGRFLTEARLAERLGGEHPYAYAKGNPLQYTDASGLAPECAGQDPCDKYPHEPGFWDQQGFKDTVDAAIKEKSCAGLSPAYLRALLKCITQLESRDHPSSYTFPTTGKGVQGPCQIWPGSDKDKLCGKDWRSSLRAHMRCCALILCQCLKRRRNILDCGTVGTGANRSGQFQVINQSTSSFSPRFRCCLKHEGLANPSHTIPSVLRKKSP